MGRYYKHNGRDLPSVTTICGILDKPALVQWSANMACDYILDELGDINSRIQADQLNAEIVGNIVNKARTEFRKMSKKAMDIGSNVHAAIERYLLTGKEPLISVDAEVAGFLAFLEWSEQYDMRVIETEKTVYSELYAGTCDLVCTLGNKKYLIDFKTSKLKDGSPAYAEHRYQVAAYRQTDPTIDGTGVLYLDKVTGYPQWRDVSGTYEKDVSIFNCLVELWYLVHDRKAKQIKGEI